MDKEPTEKDNTYREAKGDISTERLCPACNTEMQVTRSEGIFIWKCTNEACDYFEQIG